MSKSKNKRQSKPGQKNTSANKTAANKAVAKTKNSSSKAKNAYQKNQHTNSVFPTGNANSLSRETIVIPSNKSNKNTKSEKNTQKAAKSKKQFSLSARKRLLYLIGFFAAACLLLAGIVWIFFHNNAVAVNVGDVQVGVIAAKENVTSEAFKKLITAKLKEIAGNNLEVTDEITLTPVHASKKKIENIETVLSSVCSMVSYRQEAIAINVNDKQYVIVANQSIADEVMEEALAAYELPAGTSNPQFADKVETAPVYIEGSSVSSKNVALSKMTEKKTEQRVHTVVAGETFGIVASEFGLTMDELLALNPDVTMDNIQALKIGQQLNVTVKVPVVAVKSFLTTTTEEEIPYETEIIENNNEKMSFRNVITEGVNGVKQVTEQVIYVNGIKKNTAVQSEKIIKEPINEKVEVGTLSEDSRAAAGNFIFPVTGIISSVFGPRDYGSGYHYGLDIAADGGNPVHAADAGTVTFAGWNSGGYGNLVIINHNNGYVTYYAHNSALCVNKGDKVKQGTVIAKIGSTGDSTGNHCHFEIIRNGKKMDPLNFLSVY